MEFRDIKRQYQILKTEIDTAIADVNASGAFIMGKQIKELEALLAEYVGVKHCLSCANGTDALTLALKVWGIGAGDAVFVPDFTFFSSAEVIALEGATPVFVDVCPETFNMGADSLVHAIQAVKAEGKLHPKAIIAVDLFGLPADFKQIKAIAQREQLLLLEDGAQGFGGAIDGKKACSFGDIATTSFFPAKPLGCYGDGGAVFTDNDEWADLVRSYRVHGKGTNKYDNIRIGLNSRLDTLQAAILQVKFRAFVKQELTLINQVAERYNSNLRGIVLPTTPLHFTSSWAQYTLRLKDTTERTALQAFLKSHDIPSMVYYPTTMSDQTAFNGTKRYIETPNSHQLAQTVLSLPIHPYMTEAESQTVIDTIHSFYN